jgi:hypothetical protein
MPLNQAHASIRIALKPKNGNDAGDSAKSAHANGAGGNLRLTASQQHSNWEPNE